LIRGSSNSCFPSLTVPLSVAERNSTSPDGQAATWLSDRARQGNDNQVRLNVTRQIGRLLADAVHAYTKQRPPKDYRIRIEETIESAEKALKTIVAAVQLECAA